MKKKFIAITLSILLVLVGLLGAVACEPEAAPEAAPAEFGNLRIANTFVTVYDTSNAWIRVHFPSVTGLTLATLTGTETFTNKTMTSPTINSPTIATPTITGTPIVANRASGNVTLASGVGNFAHGLASQPQVVLLTGVGTGATDITITAVTSTNVTLASTNATASNIVHWLAILASE